MVRTQAIAKSNHFRYTLSAPRQKKSYTDKKNHLHFGKGQGRTIQMKCFSAREINNTSVLLVKSVLTGFGKGRPLVAMADRVGNVTSDLRSQITMQA